MFVCLNRHRCKVNIGVLSSVLPFSDDYFPAPDKFNRLSAFYYYQLDAFKYDVFNYLSYYKGNFAIGYLNIKSVFDKFC